MFTVQAEGVKGKVNFKKASSERGEWSQLTGKEIHCPLNKGRKSTMVRACLNMKKNHALTHERKEGYKRGIIGRFTH